MTETVFGSYAFSNFQLPQENAACRYTDAILPEPGTNVANRMKIRKGDLEQGMLEADVVVEEDFSFRKTWIVLQAPRAKNYDVVKLILTSQECKLQLAPGQTKVCTPENHYRRKTLTC